MTYAHGYGVGQADAFYSPHSEPFIDCECGTCEDVAVCAIPGHLIFAGREYARLTRENTTLRAERREGLR